MNDQAYNEALSCWNSIKGVSGVFEHPTRDEFIERWVYDVYGEREAFGE